jgi:hypothetical protein
LTRNYVGISTSYTILFNIHLSNLSSYTDEIIGGHHRSTTDQTFAFIYYLGGGRGGGVNKTVHQLFTSFKEANDSVRREVFYSILIEFGVTMKLVRLIKLCLNETGSRVHTEKYLSGNSPIQNGLNKGDALTPLFFNFALEYAIRKIQQVHVAVSSPKCRAKS